MLLSWIWIIVTKVVILDDIKKTLLSDKVYQQYVKDKSILASRILWIYSHKSYGYSRFYRRDFICTKFE